MPSHIHKPCSDLVAISKLNGEFRKNYGTLVGAYLYLRTINAARARRQLGYGWILAALSTAFSWVRIHRML